MRFLTLLGVAALWAASFSFAVAKDASVDAPPAGLKPTSLNVNDVLKLHHLPHERAVIEDWSFVDTGVSGSEHLERSGTNYDSRITQGPLTERFGQLNGKRWHQDFNGMTSSTSDIDDVSFQAVRVREDASDPKNDVRVIGETSGEHPAYVIEVHRPHYLHPEWIYYDAATGTITRVEYVSGKSRVVETYDDFRTVDGVTQAWHIHDSYSDHVLDDDWKLTKFETVASIPASHFAEPPSSSSVFSQAPKGAFQAVITRYGYTTLRLSINGRGLDFELDSSSPSSFIDRQVAHELGLPTFGHATHLSNGKPLNYLTMIPDATVGPIRMHDFAVYASDIHYKINDDTKVVGVLGYDFLASNVIHVDYVNKTVEAIPAAAFSGDKPVPNALEIPLTVDDGVPFVPMVIGSGFTNRAVLCDDVPWTIVFGPYMDAHAGDFVDMEKGHHHRETYVPFADQSGFGQKAQVWVSQTPSLRFANANYVNLPIISTNFPYETSGRAVDAMLGNDYLRYFDLYFDFPHRRFFVVPNKWFFEIFKKHA